MSSVRFFSAVSLLASFLSLGATANGFTLPSNAETWSALGDGKQVYIEGFCAGASGTDTGRLHCGDTAKGIDSKTPFAFCGQAYESSGTVQSGKGIGFLNAFYKDSNHSDLPLWAVVRLFNDKACSESRVSGKVQAMQEKFLCLRQAGNMAGMGVVGDVLTAQQKKCEKLP